MTVRIGPLIVKPEVWTLVFNREASSWFASLFAFGHYKHVRAYAYVPYLHVWVFYDVHLSGTDIVVAADGEPAQAMIASWIEKADLIRVKTQFKIGLNPPLLGFCVPAIKRLIGLRGGALRPDALFRYCLRNGGQTFQADCDDGRHSREDAKIPAAAT